jgi:hypothetical protein
MLHKSSDGIGIILICAYQYDFAITFFSEGTHIKKKQTGYLHTKSTTGYLMTALEKLFTKQHPDGKDVDADDQDKSKKAFFFP